MSKKITLLGSTGSIGTQSLDVIRAQGYEVFGLSAHSHVEKILEQIEEFHPRYVCMTDPGAAARLDAALAGRAQAPRLLTGPEGLKELAAMDGPDVVLNSVVGIAGLGASLTARAAMTWHWPTRKALSPAAIWSRRQWQNTASSCCLWTVSTPPSSSVCRIRRAPRA